MDRQENSAIQFDNTREMGRVLSEHNQESRNVRSHDTSITTSSNGISNFGEQRSEQEERSGANRYGDTSGRTDKSQSIHSNRTPNLFSFISRNDDERQGADTRRNNQQSVLETATRNDGYERRSLKSGQKLDFVRDSRYDNIAGIRSYAYVVTDADKSQLQISSNSTVLAKYRYVNNQKDYYLQAYNPRTNSLGTIFPNYSTSWGQNAMKIMNEFRSKY